MRKYEIVKIVKKQTKKDIKDIYYKVVFKTDHEKEDDFERELDHYIRNKIGVDHYHDLNKLFYFYDKFSENFKKEVEFLTANRKRALHKDLFKSLEIAYQKIIQEFKETSIHYFL